MPTTPPKTPTKPIAPAAKTDKPPADTPAPTKAGAANTKPKKSIAAEDIKADASAPVKNHPRSTLDRQVRAATKPTFYAPVEITFLTGTLKGETLDLNPTGRSLLGIAINEIDQTQQAMWPDRSEKGIRMGSQFEGVSARTFRLSLEFWSETEDVAQLAENLSLLQEIQPDTNTPPSVLVRQGKIEADPCVCTDLSIKYDTPLPGGIAGYRHAKAEVSFKLLGGVISQHSLARPLGPSVLQDLRQDESQADRDRKGEAAVAAKLLHPCLKDEADKVEELMLGNKLDATSLGQLSANARVQMAIAGKIPGSTLNDERFQTQLQQDLAEMIAQNEDGVGRNTQQTRQFARAVQTGDTTGVIPSLAPSVDAARQAYTETLSAIQTGNFDNKSPLFTQPDLTRRLQNFGSCGLRIRAKGAEPAPPSESDAANPNPVATTERQTINGINQAIATQSNADLKTMFGLKDNASVERLRSGAPYTDRAQFIQHMSPQIKMGAVDAWRSAEAAIATPPTTDAAAAQ